MLGVGSVARMTGGDVWFLAGCPPLPRTGRRDDVFGDRVEGGWGAYSSTSYPPRGTSTDQAKEMKYKRKGI